MHNDKILIMPTLCFRKLYILEERHTMSRNQEGKTNFRQVTLGHGNNKNASPIQNHV